MSKDISSDAYNEFPSDDATAVQKHRVQGIQSVHLLVPKKNHLEVEYTFKNANNLIGIAKYILSKKMPKELIEKLLTAEEFQRVLIPETKTKVK